MLKKIIILLSIFTTLLLMLTGCLNSEKTKVSSNLNSETSNTTPLNSLSKLEENVLNVSNNMSSLQKQLNSYEDYEYQIKQIDDIILYLDKIKSIQFDLKYSSLNDKLLKETETMIDELNTLKMQYEKCRDEYKKVDDYFNKSADNFDQILNESANMKEDSLSNEITSYINEVMQYFNSISTSPSEKEYVDTIYNITNLTAPKEFTELHNCLSSNIQKLKESYAAYENCVDSSREIVLPIFDLLEKDILEFLVTYNDLTEMIKKDYPEIG